MKAQAVGSNMEQFPLVEIYGDVKNLSRTMYFFLAIVVLGLVAGITIYLTAGDTTPALILTLELIPVAVAFCLVRSRRFETATAFLAVSLIVVNTLNATNQHGIHSVNTLGFLIILVIGSLVTSRRTMIFLITLTVCCLAWLVFGEIGGLYTPQVIEQSTVGDFFTAALIVVLTAVIAFRLTHSMFLSFSNMQLEVIARRELESSLRQREAILEAVTFAAEQFLKTPDWRANINTVLERLGRTIHATHAYLFEDHLNSQGEEVTSMRYEWTAQGYASDLDHNKFQASKIDEPGFENLVDAMRRGEVWMGNASTFKPNEQERMAAMGVKAILEVPIFVNGKAWGTIGFDDLEQERDWANTEVDALKIAAGILSAAIQRQEAESSVRESERIYRQAIEAVGAVPYYLNYRENRYEFIGAEIEKIIGYKAEEITPQLWPGIMLENHPLGEAEGLSIHEAISYSRAGKLKTWRSDMRVAAKNGEVRWITDSAVELFDDNDLSYASVGIMQDVTDRKKTEAGLRKREAMVAASTFAAEQFLRAVDWRMTINDVLEKLGIEFNASHAYLFEKHMSADGVLLNSLRYEWVAQGQTPDIDNPDYQNAPIHDKQFAHYYAILDSGEPFAGGTSYFKAESSEKEWMDESGIKALLEMRIVVDGRQWGTIGFDDKVNEREWTPMEVDVIRVAANVLGAAIKRQLDQDALRRELEERKLTEVNLRKRETILSSLAFAAEQFLKTPDWRDAIDSVLERLGKELNVSHAYLFERYLDPNGEIRSSMRNEWAAPGEISDLDNKTYHNMPLNDADIADVYKRLDNGQPFIGSSSAFSEKERDHWRSLGVKALLEMRIIVDGRQWGLIGFDDSAQDREWLPIEVDVITVAANVLGAAIKRQLDEDALKNELTERKRAEENYRSIFNNSIDGIFQSSDDGRFLTVNPAMARIYGYESPEEMISSVHDIGSQLYVDARQRDELRRRLASGGRLIGHEILEYRKDGSVFWTSMTAQAVMDENGQPLYYEGTIEDITPRKLAEVEREKLIADLEAKNTELERFTYTVSHDLKSPLVTINGFLGYLEQDAASGNTERLKKDTRRIQEAVNKMQRLLNDLLELSRIGRMMNSPQANPFNDLVSEALDIVQGGLNERRVQVSIQPGLPVIVGDKPRLVEVLQNLLDNAAKYMGSQPNPRIEIGQQGEEDGKPIFFVRDNGMGIAPEYHERIFGLFNKLDAASEGTGIGLALVKRIIEVHEGRIWVESTLGGGSVFYFTLPEEAEHNHKFT